MLLLGITQGVVSAIMQRTCEISLNHTDIITDRCGYIDFTLSLMIVVFYVLLSFCFVSVYSYDSETRSDFY